jgi:hypothetical protein
MAGERGISREIAALSQGTRVATPWGMPSVRGLSNNLVLLTCWLAAATSCGSSFCDCFDGDVGLIITADAPVTRVELSGDACAKGTFRCIPADFDNTVHGDCEQMQVIAPKAGTCIVDLTVGGQAVRLERQMVESTCDCYGRYFTEVDRHGRIDLSAKADGGARAMTITPPAPMRSCRNPAWAK